MAKTPGSKKFAGYSTMASAIAMLFGCGGSGSEINSLPAAAAPTTVQKAQCQPTDAPEKDLQGQVSAAVRAAGFKGYNCNLKLVGQSKGDGASWQHAWFTDKAGHRCSYYDTSSATVNRTQTGTVVIDATDATNPTPTAYLTTTGMHDPWESLKVNERRQMLGGVNALNGNGGPQIDLYDISSDCRHPQLLTDNSVGLSDGTGQFIATVQGHEGNFAPDGMTYYAANLGAGYIYPIDISNTTQPKLLTKYTTAPGRVHGLNISDDGTRAYVAIAGQGGQLRAAGTPQNNGLLILDVSQVQNRVPNPVITPISVLTWDDGGTAQHEINVNIGAKPYIIHADEAGSGGNSAAGWAAACAAGQPAWQYARIIDLSDEKNPKVVSKLMLEAYDPKNCSQVVPDLAGLSAFTYGSHYCSVDNKTNATTLACGYFNSGIRVFDIRDPLNVREIAYYNPAGTTTSSPGSNHLRAGGWVAGGPDWCNAQVRLDADSGTLQTTCQDNGFLSLKFEAGVWPFPGVTTPPGLGN